MQWASSWNSPRPGTTGSLLSSVSVHSGTSILGLSYGGRDKTSSGLRTCKQSPLLQEAFLTAPAMELLFGTISLKTLQPPTAWLWFQPNNKFDPKCRVP